MTKLYAIVAMAENRVIGYQNRLPWHLPADLRHFKALTTGHCILMGRKTYESIGRPLPNRTNLILTRDPHYQAPGCLVSTDLNATLSSLPEQEVFVIGGAEIYQQLLAQIERIYLTTIHHPFEGDAHFPILNARKWQETETARHPADEENKYAHTFSVLERK